MCLDDILRTKQFIKGIFKAIATLQKKQQKPIHILYAGTGPYATLLLPVLATYSAQEVIVTLVEINKESFNSMKSIIHKLDFENHVVHFKNEDATTMKLDSTPKIDIILSETLQCGLVKEQQVPITLNLLHQVEDSVILIPEMLALDVCLFNHNSFTNRNENTKEGNYLQVLDRLIEINNSSNEAFKLNTDSTVTTILSEKKIKINPSDATTFDALVLVTRMTIFQDITIDLNQSGLTVPIIIDVLSNHTEEKTFTISYKIDSEPGFAMHWL
ncbi:MAG: hypothetical protein HC854_10665 [Flavobacterium sp.]|nr:hypothetical protein [Flavobacterium sp.]